MGNDNKKGKKKDDFEFVLKSKKFEFLSNTQIKPTKKEISQLLKYLPKGMKYEDPNQVYKTVELVGKGSYGKVFKIKRYSDSEMFACKIISCTNEEKETVHQILNEVLKEIQILSDLENHKNIIKYVDSFYHNTKFWIVLENCEAGSILDYIEYCTASLTEKEICSVCKQLLKGLAFLHTKNKIHRDVKCGNILLDSKGIVKLADFGISAQLSKRGDKLKALAGSSYWLAPEVLSYSTYDEKADLWSLGIAVLEMAERFPPYWNLPQYKIFDNIQTKSSPNFKEPDNWSEDFQDFLSQCLIKDSSSRPSAVKLLRHPFFNQVKDEGAELMGIVKKIKEKLDEVGGKEALIKSLQKKKKKKKKKRDSED